MAAALGRAVRRHIGVGGGRLRGSAVALGVTAAAIAAAAPASGMASVVGPSAGGASDALALASASSSAAAPPETLTVLQWNAHGQCFLQCLDGAAENRCDPRFPVCRDGARDFLAEVLQNASLNLDLVALEGFNFDALVVGGGGHGAGPDLRERWANATHECGGEAGYGVFPFDTATLLYDTQRWELAGAGDSVRRSGCFEHVAGNSRRVSEASSGETPNYRAFLVQALRRKGGSEVVVAVVSHHPHTNRYSKEIGLLQAAVQEVAERASAHRVIMMADTNNDKPRTLPWPSGRSSQALMEDVFPKCGAVVSTELFDTCCAWTYNYAYDRAIAAGFPGASMETVLPFGGDGHPSFAAIDMHDPIVGRLTYGEGRGAAAASPFLAVHGVAPGPSAARQAASGRGGAAAAAAASALAMLLG